MYVVSYDITSNRRRRRISKCLENYGRRIQYSVFECDIDEKRYKQMYKDILKETDGMTDGSVRFYYLCGNCITKMQLIGQDKPSVFVSNEDTIVI